MFELTAPYWNPDDAPTTNIVKHETPALAALLAQAQSEPKRMLFGAPPSVTRIGDVPDGASKADGARMYLKAPEWADRGQVIVCASGLGMVCAEHETNGTAVGVEIPGDAAVTTISEYMTSDGGENDISEATPSPALLQLDAGAINRVAIWKDTTDLTVWSICVRWLASTP